VSAAFRTAAFRTVSNEWQILDVRNANQ